MTRDFFRDIWRLARPYWFSDDRWPALGLLAVIVAMSLGMVFINVLFNKWYGDFYNALQNHDIAAFYRQLLVFCGLAAVFIALWVYQVYLRQMLRIRWRRWMTDRYLDEWLEGQAYYTLQMQGGTTDNPDQRIAEDINQFVAQAIDLPLGLLESAAALAAFSGILWQLSGTLIVPVFGAALAIPGYMVWAALAYAAVATWLAAIIGRPLIQLNYDQQRYEADFRFSLVRFRENTEGVALYRGEQDEKRVFGDRFANVVSNWWGIMKQQKRLSWLTTGYGQAAVVFPFLAAAPRYFSGAIELGGLIQTSQAFGQVQGALSWFVYAYTGLAAWKATVDRLTSFQGALAEIKQRNHAPGGIAVARAKREVLRLSGLDLALPEGTPLIKAVDLEVGPGESLLISGPSGIGKSTLFRAVAGIWPFGRGRIDLPATGRVLFLPQKPYLPIGSLRTVATYPRSAVGFADTQIAEALTACGLGHLAARLDESLYWPQILSPGEQQRLAFARALLHKPDWLLLDEATAALDEASERMLYRLLRERMPKTTTISIGHRASLAEFHRRQMQLIRRGHGPSILIGAPVV